MPRDRQSRSTMSRYVRVIIGRLVCGSALLGLISLAACIGVADKEGPSGSPSFYRTMANGSAQLDASAAQSMISGYRQNNGLSSVTLDPALMRMAEDQARAMVARDKLDHNVGRSFDARLRASGFDAKFAVENIGAGYHTLAEAFSGWRDSPAHRANMLKGGVTRMGIAAVYSPRSKYKVFWSLVLAAPGERKGS